MGVVLRTLSQQAEGRTEEKRVMERRPIQWDWVEFLSLREEGNELCMGHCHPAQVALPALSVFFVLPLSVHSPPLFMTF